MTSTYQAEISRITFPRIGQVTRLCDGTYDVGPLEGLGGPFDTAAEYFEAWARHVEFPMGDDKIRACSGPAADEILQSIAEFPARIGKLASRLCARDAGPFPLIHPDFGHNNIIVDDEYNVLGVIDWEGAQTVPWAAINFPLTLSAVPKAADAPWCYDADGQPKDPKSRERAADRVRYVAAVREAERKAGSPTPLADCLGDPKVQDVAAAMHLFNDGKVGFFTKVLDQHYPDSSAKSLPP